MEKQNNFKSLGEAIKYIRWYARVSQQDFAKEIGCATVSVSSWEQNKKMPSFRMYRKIQDFIKQHKIKITLP